MMTNRYYRGEPDIKLLEDGGRALVVDGGAIADAMHNADPVGAHSATNAPDAVVTLTRPAGANVLWIQTEMENIRLTLDSTDPNPLATPPVGFLLKPEDGVRSIRVPEGAVVKYRRETSGAVVQVQWMA